MTHPRLSELLAAHGPFDPDAMPVAIARATIAAFVRPIDEADSVPLREALGRVLAHDVISPIDVPAHDNAAMDGWAVRAADLAADADTALAAVGEALAGRPFAGRARPGEAVRVTTGAVMPEGADTVVVQEVVRVEGGRVVVPPGQRAGQHRRARGEDLAAGRPALAAGRVLRAPDLGLLASLGLDRVPVRRRARVALLSTGDELRAAGEPLPAGCVYDSNGPALRAMIERLGAEVIDLGVVRDSADAIGAALRDAGACADAIVCSGGVSAGSADLSHDAAARLGEVATWTLAMRPGRSIAFGRVGDALFFGLPGNPVAASVAFLVFARDALLRLSGAVLRPVHPVRAIAAQRIPKRRGRAEYARAVLEPGDDGMPRARLAGAQGSGVLRSMAEADALLVLPAERGDVEPGEALDALPFDGLM